MAVFTSTGTAAAAEPAPATHSVNPPPQPRTVLPEGSHWYGWQGLAMDGVAVSLAWGAFSIGKGDVNEADLARILAVGGLVAYGLGAPVIHVVHQKPWHALGSLGLRGGLPLAVAFFTDSSARCPPPNSDYGSCGAGSIVGGAVAGALIAIVFDAVILSWEAPRVMPTQQARIGVLPVVSIEGQRELRVVGTF